MYTASSPPALTVLGIRSVHACVHVSLQSWTALLLYTLLVCQKAHNLLEAVHKYCYLFHYSAPCSLPLEGVGQSARMKADL